jgi:hypothetical protein
MFDNSLAMFNENSGAVYNAIEFRRNFGAHTNNLAGVMGYGDFLCSVSGANISIAAGSAYVADIGGASFGQYFARTSSFALANTIVRTPNNSGVARNDCVYIRILDTTRGDSIDSCDLVYEAGAVTPSAPRALLLATIAVSGANVAVATDARKFSGTYQGIYRTTIANLTVPTDGGPRYAHILDTNLTQQYDAVRLWHPLAAGIPHASVARVIQTVGGNSTLVYAAMPTAVNLSFTKYRADTTLIVDFSVSYYGLAGYTQGRYGIFFSASTTEVLLVASNTASNHQGYSGSVAITGVAAGTNTYSVYWRHVGANAMTVDTNDQITLKLTETF